MDIADLKEKMHEALLDGLRTKDLNQRQRAAEEAAKKQVEAARADQILRALPEKAKKAIIDGDKTVVAMQLHYPQDLKYSDREAKAEWIHGAAAIVYESLAAIGYELTLKFQYDGGGRDSWFDLHVGLHGKTK